MSATGFISTQSSGANKSYSRIPTSAWLGPLPFLSAKVNRNSFNCLNNTLYIRSLEQSLWRGVSMPALGTKRGGNAISPAQRVPGGAEH